MNYFLLNRDASGPAQTAMRDWEIPGPDGAMPVRSYTPQSPGLLPVVLYFHGGGFTGGGIDDAHIPAGYIAMHCPAIVLCVAYSLAPARPFPAAPEDAYRALDWTAQHAAAIGGRSHRLAVAGDEAGGNLAASLTLIARDRNGPAIAAQALLAPMLDPSMTHRAAAADMDASARRCATCYGKYLPLPSQRLHPYAAPLESRRLGALPPALIATANGDAMHAEAEQYAGLLAKAGVPTRFTRYPGVSAGGLHAHVPALAELVDFLRRHLWAGRGLPFSSSLV